MDLKGLRAFLISKRDFVLRLLENPVLLETESFTELLRASFALEEELKWREDLKLLPPSDYSHLAGDAQLVYAQLVSEWLDYMRYLKKNYPYLFSLAMRANRFDQGASVAVK